MKAQHKAATLLAGVALAVTALPAAAQDNVSFQLWTKEGTGDGSFQFVQKLVDEYAAALKGAGLDQARIDALVAEFRKAQQP